MRAEAVSLRTFSGAPVGAFPKNGSRCGRFPWHNSPGRQGSRRMVSAGTPSSQRTRNVPQRRRRARWGARPSSVDIILRRGLGVLEILEFLENPTGDENPPRPGPRSRSARSLEFRPSDNLPAGSVEVFPPFPLLDDRLQVLEPDDPVLHRVFHDGADEPRGDVTRSHQAVAEMGGQG
jgi:hypothetical protein